MVILGLLLTSNDNKRNRRLYIIICSIVLLFVASMRSAEWMTFTYRLDTYGYKCTFEEKIVSDQNGFWPMLYERYWLHESENDIGFYALQKIIGLFTHNYYIFSLIADLIFFVPFGMILYRYCTNIRQIIFAYVFYIALIQVFLFGGGRQIFAIGFDMMALLAMADKKTWRSFIFLLLGVSIHFSSFLFLLPLLMIRYKTSSQTLKLLHLACFFAIPIVLLFSSQIIVLMGEAVGMAKYAKYGAKDAYGGGTIFIFLIESLSLLCLLSIRKSDLENNENIRLLYVMFPLMTLLAPLIYTGGAMIRISLYYHLYLAILVPYSIDCRFKEKDKRIVYIVAIMALAYLTLSGGGGTRYYFYWQV